MTPDRRQFVASLASVPFLLQTTSTQQSGKGGARFSDPVLEQIVADLRELVTEFEREPAARKGTMRAMEATLGIEAAHMGVHYDADLQAALRRRRTRIGKAALVQEIITMAHDKQYHAVSHEAVDAALTRLEQRGLAGCLRDMQVTIKKLRQQVPDQFAAVSFRSVQFDYCSDLRWMISIMESAVAIACGIALLEPTPGGEIACGAMTLSLGLLYAQRAFWC